MLHTYNSGFLAAIAEMIPDGLVGWIMIDTDDPSNDGLSFTEYVQFGLGPTLVGPFVEYVEKYNGR